MSSNGALGAKKVKKLQDLTGKKILRAWAWSDSRQGSWIEFITPAEPDGHEHWQ
jgi:hypothetical protein